MVTSSGPFAKRQDEMARRKEQTEKQAGRVEAKDRPAEPGSVHGDEASPDDTPLQED